MKHAVMLAFLLLVLTTPIFGQMQPQPPTGVPQQGNFGQPQNNPQEPPQAGQPGDFGRPQNMPMPPAGNVRGDDMRGPQNPGMEPQGMRGNYGQGPPPGAFQSDFGGLYRQPEEMKQQWNDFQDLAAPDLRPQQAAKTGSKLAVTDRISTEKMVSGMIVERLSEYFNPEELLKNCPDDGKITDKVMGFIDKNSYVLEDICWPVEDRVDDCKLEREQCEEIKQPKTRGGFNFTCPASEETVEKECMSEGEKRLDEESKRFTENAPTMCEREWLMNEMTVTQMCQDNCDEQRFLRECERQVQNLRQRQQQNQPQQQNAQEGWQQPQQWGERRQDMQPPMQQGQMQPPMPQQQMQPGQQMPPQPGQQPPPNNIQPPTDGQPMPPAVGQQPTQPTDGQPAPATGTGTTQPPSTEPAPTTNTGATQVPPPPPTGPAPAPPPATEPAPAPAAPTGYAIAALDGNTDCSKQVENFRQMCKQITEKSDRMCSKDAFIKDCKERNEKQFDKEQISKEMERMCKQSAKRGAVMMNRACRQMDHEYKSCVGRVEQACNTAQEQADVCNKLMGRDKVKEAVSEKAKELCRFSEYKTLPEKAGENSSQMAVTIAIASDTPESSIGSLRQLADGLAESHSEGNIRIYTGKTSQKNYESIKKLDFVLDAKPYGFENAGGKGIKTAVTVLEASKEQLPEDFRVWVSNEENNLIDVNDKVDGLTKPKGFSYDLKKAIGLAKAQELNESEDLKKQGEKIDETIKSLGDISAQVDDISVKAALQKQIDQLKEQKDSLDKASAERKKSAAGIFSMFG